MPTAATSVRYHYRAATAEGRVVEGEMRAASRQTALEELRRQKLYPVTIAEVAPVATKRGRSLGRRAAVTLWTRTAAVLLGAGVPLDRVLAFTTAQAGHDGLAEALKQVTRQVQGGVTLADALAAQRGFFPPLVIAMVSAGEASGSLDIIFERLAEHLEESAELRSQVKSALLYPALMAVVATIGVTVLLLFVVPRFTAILEDVGGTLPLSTRLLVGVSDALARWWWLLLALVAAGAFALRASFASPESRRAWHRRRLAWPWIGELELRYATAQFTRTLGLLLKSGAPMLTALRVARAAVPNLAIAAGVERAATEVSEGGALAPALQGTLPAVAIRMLAAGEESGRLEELCGRIAGSYDAEVRRALRNLVAMVEPAMILAFGLLVGFVALAMLQAIYSINANAF